jgi:DNA-binding transcriptional ArsR family regulator
MAPFEILAEEQRRRILDLLRARERPVGELVVHLTLSQPAVSKHLKVLRQAGLVESRIDAQRRIYRLCPDSLREIDDWLAPYRGLWAERSTVDQDVIPDDEFEIGGTPV